MKIDKIETGLIVAASKQRRRRRLIDISLWEIKLRIKWFFQKLWWGKELNGDIKHHPVYGKGKFVDVLSTRNGIDIVNHDLDVPPKGTIRLIPMQSSHGVLVEYRDTEGKLCWRVGCDYKGFFDMGFLGKEHK